jgi:hypothetical protein
MFYCRENFHRIEGLLIEVGRNVTGQLPNALKNKFCHLGFLRFWLNF